MAWLGVVTNAGKELLGGWLAGQELQIAGAAGGSGTVQEAALLAQTNLVAQKQTASIVSYKTVEGGQKIKLQFPAAATAYQLNQIGIWGNCGGENKLLALFQNPEGVAISSRAEFPDFAYTFYAVLAIGNEGSLAVTVDAEAWVTLETLQEALSDYVKVNESGKIPDELLPAMDYIPKAEKNAANGVAGLDANKKIVIAQLPMDAALSNSSENPVQNKVIYAALAGKVPTTRKVNGKALTADISLSAADVGARPSSWTPAIQVAYGQIPEFSTGQRSISTGFAPKLIILAPAQNRSNTNSNGALGGMGAYFVCVNGSLSDVYVIVTFTSSGFTLTHFDTPWVSGGFYYIAIA